MPAPTLGRVAGRIRDSDIAEVRDRTRIEEVVGEYVALRRAGAGSLKGLCPFHDEKTPSFTVRPSHNSFHCFGCAEGGGVIDFVMRIEHIGFVEAVERLADQIGFRLTYTGGGSSVQRDRGTRSRLLEANKKAAEFYAAALRTPEAAPAVRVPHLARVRRRRRAERSAADTPPAGWDALTKHLLAAGFSLDELMKAGLTKEGRRGPIDRFHRRLLWPIRDLGGDVVGFGGRRIFDDDPHRGQVPQHPRDARLPQDARAVRARPGEARDRQGPPGRRRRGLHGRHGHAPRRRAAPPSRPAARRSGPSTSA